MIVIKKFGASWCGPCKRYNPILDRVSKERDDIAVIHIDVDEDKELASKYGVRGVPFTVLEREDGTPIVGFQGAQTYTELNKIIEIYKNEGKVQ